MSSSKSELSSYKKSFIQQRIAHSYIRDDSSSEEQDDDESLSQMIQNTRNALLKDLSSAKQLYSNAQSRDATFDLSDTMHDHIRVSLPQPLNIETRIQRLERELQQSLQSTTKKIDDSISISSYDSIHKDFKVNKQLSFENSQSLTKYQERLAQIKQSTEVKTYQTKAHDNQNQQEQVLVQIDSKLNILQQELQQLKTDLFSDNSKQQIRHVPSVSHEEHKSVQTQEDLTQYKSANEIINYQHQYGSVEPSIENQSGIQAKYHQNKIDSLDVIPQRDFKKKKSPLQGNIDRYQKLNKEIEVLQQIERVRSKLKKSIQRKMSKEKLIEKFDPSYNMPSKTSLMNKSSRQHCPNCAYLMNKGISTAICSCNK